MYTLIAGNKGIYVLTSVQEIIILRATILNIQSIKAWVTIDNNYVSMVNLLSIYVEHIPFHREISMTTDVRMI